MPASSTYSEDVVDEICRRIAEGEALYIICREPGMPANSTVTDWLNIHPTFAAKYARARDLQADYMADQTVVIADTATDPALAKLQIDARKWKAGKLASRYSEKMTTTIEGGDKPLQVADATPLETARRIAFALANGAAQASKETDNGK